MGLQFGGKKGDCPVTEDYSDRLLRLPFYNSFTEAEQAEVIAAIKDWSRHKNNGKPEGSTAGTVGGTSSQ